MTIFYEDDDVLEYRLQMLKELEKDTFEISRKLTWTRCKEACSYNWKIQRLLKLEIYEIKEEMEKKEKIRKENEG